MTQFAFDLLRARYLFDRFVIKTDRTRESDDDSNWVLHRVRKLESGGKNRLSPIATFGPSDAADEASLTGEHEHVLMLQSMFQVTDSRRSYKNFLYAMLEFLFANDETITASTFIGFLAKLADERYRLNVTRDQLDRGRWSRTLRSTTWTTCCGVDSPRAACSISLAFLTRPSASVPNVC